MTNPFHPPENVDLPHYAVVGNDGRSAEAEAQQQALDVAGNAALAHPRMLGMSELDPKDVLDHPMNVIVGGNAIGKSALVEAQLAARKHHGDGGLEGAVFHISEVQRSITNKGDIPFIKYPRNPSTKNPTGS